MKLRGIEWYKIIQRPRDLIYLSLRSIYCVKLPNSLRREVRQKEARERGARERRVPRKNVRERNSQKKNSVAESDRKKARMKYPEETQFQHPDLQSFQGALTK
jgi:hypothetical protein